MHILLGHTAPSLKILGLEKVNPNSCRVADLFKALSAVELSSILLDDIFTYLFKSKPWLKSTFSLKLILPLDDASITKLVKFLMSAEEILVVVPLKFVIKLTENVLSELFPAKPRLSVQLMLQL